MTATVYVAACDRYDRHAIADRVHTASEALGVAASDGHEPVVAVHCPWVHPRFAPNAAPPHMVIAGVLAGLDARSATIGALGAPGFPTRYGLAQAGYGAVARAQGARLVPFDERPMRRVRPSTTRPALPEFDLPAPWVDASMRILVVRLAGSQLLPLSGALRALYGLLPADAQLSESQHAADVAIDVASAAPPTLIVVDGIEATHRGGELSGEPVELGALILGTDPLAVDAVAAEAYGVSQEELAAALRGGATSIDDVQLVGDVGREALQARATRVERLDPAPERFPLPGQVTVMRSPRSSTVGVAGGLTEMFAVLRRAGIGLDKARETAFVIGAVDDIPRGNSEQATIVFLGDSARGDYAGYSRIIRLAGRHVPVSRLLMDVPFAMTVANVRSELGFGFLMARITGGLSRLFARIAGTTDRGPRPTTEAR